MDETRLKELCLDLSNARDETSVHRAAEELRRFVADQPLEMQPEILVQIEGLLRERDLSDNHVA